MGYPGWTASRKSQPAPAGQNAAGGIWSNGSLTVETGCLLQGNSVTGGDGGHNSATGQIGSGGNAFGGGIYIAGGTAQISSSSIGTYDPFAGDGVGNMAQGGNGGSASQAVGAGSGYGGGVYVAAGAVTMDHVTLEANTAQSGGLAPPYNSLPSGYGYGGGLFVAGGSVTLTNDSVDHNVAGTFENGGTYAYYAHGYGGGIFIASAATVSLDPFTVSNTTNNTDSSGMPGTTANIDGTYTLLP